MGHRYRGALADENALRSAILKIGTNSAMWRTNPVLSGAARRGVLGRVRVAFTPPRDYTPFE